MATMGYVLNMASEATLDAMSALGCCRIFTEDRHDDTSRPKRRLIIKKLRPGDCLVTPRLCHTVDNCAQLSALLQMCDINDIRVVAIEDRIDTGGVLYQDESNGNLITVFRQLPYQVVELKKGFGELPRPYAAKSYKDRLKRDELVINMYLSGLSIEDIQRVAGVGRTTLYRVLRLYDISRDRLTGAKVISE